MSTRKIAELLADMFGVGQRLIAVVGNIKFGSAASVTLKSAPNTDPGNWLATRSAGAEKSSRSQVSVRLCLTSDETGVSVGSDFTKGINAMGQALRPSTPIPRGFIVDDVSSDGEATLITVHPTSPTGVCRGCGTRSERIHSRCRRRLADLPLAGKPVQLVIDARRGYCDAAPCGRRIFAERFDKVVLAPRARRSAWRLRAIEALAEEGFAERIGRAEATVGGAVIREMDGRSGGTRAHG